MESDSDESQGGGARLPFYSSLSHTCFHAASKSGASLGHSGVVHRIDSLPAAKRSTVLTSVFEITLIATPILSEAISGAAKVGFDGSPSYLHG